MLVTIQVDKDSSVFIELFMTCGDRKKKNQPKTEKSLKYREQNHTLNANDISILSIFHS